MTQGAERSLRQPDPTEEDQALLSSIVKHRLGEQATGSFIGAMAKGVKGDNAHYGHAVVINDPSIAEHRSDMDEYYEKIAGVAVEIGNKVTVAGNVTLDVTSDLLVNMQES